SIEVDFMSERKQRLKLRWQKFKRFLKRNMTPTWAKHFSYQVISFIISVFMVIGVAEYAVTKSYDERKLSFVENFTITAHSGSFDTVENSLDFVQAAINNNVEVVELDVRQRPNGTLVMAHDIVITNNDGVPIADAFEILKGTSILINLDIKETRTLNALHDLLVEYDLYGNAFLTGIESADVDAVKESTCADLDFYLNCQPSRMRIFTEDYRAKLLQTLEATGAIGVNCNYKYAGGQLSELLHENGYKLSVWTVNKQKDMKRVLLLKPDNITTKQYDLLLSTIDNWGN
ncbi:MAG: glycerophosphodiester phosphodiesterase, partial [Eubacterium sp.]|nr:glycerophosphodiester phosphodiesterase [Eubacterium sp.]